MVRVPLNVLIVVAALAWPVGLALFAWQVLTVELQSNPALHLTPSIQAVLEITDPQGRHTTWSASSARGFVAAHLATFYTWYYSPLNLRYWALAVLYLTPAFSLTMLLSALRRVGVPDWLPLAP